MIKGMKKILFITTISGFLQQFEMNDVSIVQELGYEVHYATNFYNPVYEVNREELFRRNIILHHIDIQKSPFKMVKNFKAWLQLRKIVKKEHIDVIHCHNPMGGVLGRLADIGMKGKRKIIYTAHGFHFYQGAPVLNWILYYPAEALLANRTDALITINDEDYKRAKKFHLRKLGIIKKIPGVGIDTKKFNVHTAEREGIRNELGISEHDFFVLSVGELNANKNHKVVMHAVASLQDKAIRYGICGKGIEREKLLRLADKLGISEQVILYGFRKDIPRILAAADCFVFPSRREGLGIAAIEAMAAGVPMITSDCRGTREYMVNEVNGLVCKREAVEEYVAAIRNLRMSHGRRKEFAQACRKTAMKFDIRVTDGIMRQVYADLLK